MSTREEMAIAAGAKLHRRPGCVLGGVVGWLAAMTFAASMITIVLAVGIWPGEAKLTAPLLCPSDRPDAFVVTDTYNVQPGETTTNFTLYCVGERGDFTDIGYLKPFALLTLLHGVLITLLLLGSGAMLASRKRRRAGPSIDVAVDEAIALGVDNPIVVDNPIGGGSSDVEGPISS